MTQTSFTTNMVFSQVECYKNENDYIVDNVEILPYSGHYYFKSTEKYINVIINYIKDNIIKYCDDLRKVKIYINLFDKNNIFHRLILNVSNIINDLLQIERQINFRRTIFIFIHDKDKILFCANLDFSRILLN
jgi:hypothetical protein